MKNKLAAIFDDVFIKAAPPDDLVELGKVATAHGIRGLLKIQTHADQSEALLKAKTWWLRPPTNNNFKDKPTADISDDAADNFLAVKVLSCHNHGQNILLTKFANINDRNQAELLRSYSIWLSRSEFPDTQNDEFYWVDLIACDFYGQLDESQVLLGQVSQVTENSAHAILDILLGSYDDNGVFKPKLDSKSKTQHVLVPFVAAHILDVDLSSKRISSNWPADF